MNLAATLIALKARHSAGPFLKAVGDPAAAQRRLLETILQRNRDTEYGRKCRFSSIRDLAGYQREVPVVEYEDIRGEIDRMTRGEPNVLTAEAPVMFAQTSGTTGAPKFIPVTPTCQKHGGTATWLYFARRDHPLMLAGKVITVVSPAIEGHTPAGIPFGSTSGMVVRELPKIVQKTYAVPYDAFEIADYDAEYYTLLRFGLPENITLLASANPSSVLMLAEMADRLADPLIRDIHDGKLGAEFAIEGPLREALAARLRADPARAKDLERMRAMRDGHLSPADYWPRLALIGCWKGGTVGSYLERFPEWFDPDGRGMPPVRDMGYLASEARMSVPISDNGAGGVLTVNLNVFELVPAEEVEANPDDSKAWSPLGVHEVEVGKEYHVLITTTGGLYRYDINDIIEVVDHWHGTPVVVFRRKGRGMTNLTGEKVCVNHLIEAIGKAAESAGLHASHFKAETDGAESRYIFKVEFEQPPTEDIARNFLAAMDDALGECNLEWKSKRASKRLSEPVLQVMKPGWYERGKQQLVADGKRLFQSKTILLDSKEGYQPEPGETEFEISGNL
jgi:hypothetical protein